MNKKLNKVLDEIVKVENKIAVWQEHLEELYIKKNQLEDAEIIKSVRAMKLGSREMLAFLEEIQSGVVLTRQGQSGMDTGQTEGIAEETANDRTPGSGSEEMENDRVTAKEPMETADYGNPEKESGETENNSGPGETPAEKEDKENEEKN